MDPEGAVDARRLRPRRDRGRRSALLAGRGCRAPGRSPASCTRRPSPPTPCSRASGARTALITTEGFRDVLEMRRLRIPVLYDLQYDEAAAARAAPPALRGRRADRAGRRRLRAARRASRCSAAAQRSSTTRSIAVAIALLHSYANPEHERRVAEILQRGARRRVYVTLLGRHPAGDPRVRAHQHRGRQRLRRPGRDALCALAARRSSQAVGIDAPLEIMQSSGGMMSPRGGAQAAGLPDRVGPGRRRHRLRPPGARDRARRT